VAAVSVAPEESLTALHGLADDVICLATPEPFLAVEVWYDDFSQTSDDDVMAILGKYWTETSRRASPVAG
jgi:predicted phosphoribosyltransferase